jgi:MtrB/PioB family decaheme-associated outer membrane protein
MTTKTTPRSALLAVAVSTALGSWLASPALAADASKPDTSAWKCETCPFFQGYEAGALYADGANASFGRYTGIDEEQAYVDLAAVGDWRTEAGTFASYSLQDLGLDSRSGRATIGREGRYDVSLYYDGLPYRRFDETVTPYSGFANLTLPGNWVRAGNTGGMTRLAASLGDRDVGWERETYGIDARYLIGSKWSVFANYQRQDKSGTGIIYGSFLTQAVQLPEPIDWVDETFELGTAWNTARGSARLSLSGSLFRNLNTALTFQNPYTPLIPSAGTGRLALAPDNTATQAALTGNFRLFGDAMLTYGFSIGKLEQDDALLPVSTAPNALAPRETLDGEVDLRHGDLGLAFSPLAGLSLRGTARYDERDDKTPPLSLTYVVTDSFLGTPETTPRYDYERTRFEGTADYALYSWLRVGGGLQWDRIDREQQEIDRTTEDGGFLRARLTPFGTFALTVKAGQFHREADGFDPSLRSPTENPLLRKYNLANRDRWLYEAIGSFAATDAITVSLQARRTDDAYRRSPLGLVDGSSFHVGGNVGWAATDALTLYADAGFQKYDSKLLGQARPAGPAWEARNEDEFTSVAVGGRWAVSERLSLTADAVMADARGETQLITGAIDDYPNVKSRLNSLRLGAGYQVTPALAVGVRLAYESFDEDNWMFDGVGPASSPQLLAMGALADSHDVALIALNFTYRFGEVVAPPAKEE